MPYAGWSELPRHPGRLEHRLRRVRVQDLCAAFVVRASLASIMLTIYLLPASCFTGLESDLILGRATVLLVASVRAGERNLVKYALPSRSRAIKITADVCEEGGLMREVGRNALNFPFLSFFPFFSSIRGADTPDTAILPLVSARASSMEKGQDVLTQPRLLRIGSSGA